MTIIVIIKGLETHIPDKPVAPCNSISSNSYPQHRHGTDQNVSHPLGTSAHPLTLTSILHLTQSQGTHGFNGHFLSKRGLTCFPLYYQSLPEHPHDTGKNQPKGTPPFTLNAWLVLKQKLLWDRYPSYHLTNTIKALTAQFYSIVLSILG